MVVHSAPAPAPPFIDVTGQVFARPLVERNMEKKELVLGSVLFAGALILLISACLALYFCCRRRRGKRYRKSSDGSRIRLESSDGEGSHSASQLAGFLALKTPLISTRALGIFDHKPNQVKPSRRSDLLPVGQTTSFCSTSGTGYLR
ncbi:hypothetical protein GE061_017015 [Apolygus lucorum]|uniref:Uncharacterized protein n=1 Tax=Apolygus lucorum TaxID=248454 RepID=A0A8S9XHW0_APOLU|nr:hypothetical protein GE061_017015 [Apolygus lucorum]